MAGRYDKIQVYNNGGLVTPQNMAVYNGGVLSYFGGHTDTGINTTAHVSNNGALVDYLKHPVYHSTPEVWKACNHVFQLYPVNGYCFCPTNKYRSSYSNVRNSIANHWFQGFIQKDTNEDVVVFETYNANNPNKQYYRITWQADGYIRIDIGAKETNNEGCVTSGYSSRPFFAGEICWLDTYVQGSKNGIYYDNMGFCFCTALEYSAWYPNLGSFSEAWNYIMIREGGSGGDNKSQGQYKFNVGWVNEGAVNCLGDWAGMMNGKSRLRWPVYVSVGGSQMDTGQKQAFLCMRDSANAWESTPVYLWDQYGTHYESLHYLDSVLDQEGTGYYTWE